MAVPRRADFGPVVVNIYGNLFGKSVSLNIQTTSSNFGFSLSSTFWRTDTNVEKLIFS